MNMLQAINFQAPIFNKIASAGELLLELKALRVKSVNSFHSGSIFYLSLSQKLSSATFVVSIILSEQISHWRTCPGMTPKNRDLHDFSIFLGIDKEFFGKLLGIL